MTMYHSKSLDTHTSKHVDIIPYGSRSMSDPRIRHFAASLYSLILACIDVDAMHSAINGLTRLNLSIIVSGLLPAQTRILTRQRYRCGLCSS